MTLTEIKQALDERGMRPLKRFGQNFLHDQNICRWLAGEVAGVSDGGPVVEVGPGLGCLTEPLLETGAGVRAIEIDRGLCGFLRERFDGHEAFELIEGDALEELPKAWGRATCVAGNLPYNISTALLMRLIGRPGPVLPAVFTLQKEVAARIAAEPGTRDYGSLTVALRAFYQARLARELPPAVFHPRPDVDSAVVVLRPRGDAVMADGDRAAFVAFVRRGFAQRRKMVGKALGTDDRRRAEEIDVAEWAVLYSTLENETK